MELPTLYTLTGTQSIRYWNVSVTVEDDSVYICREYGTHGGKPIINKKLITESKSRCTVYDQAVFEAKKDWKEMTEKKGYVSNLKLLVNLLRRGGFSQVKIMEDKEPSKNVFQTAAKFFCRMWFLGFIFRGDLVAVAKR